MGNNVSTNEPKYTHGYHVVKVKPNSPGEQAGLMPFFDFIVTANNQPLIQQNNQFIQILQDNINKPVNLIVYNSKANTARDVKITPSTSWGDKNELLGLSIRFCEIKQATEYVWHIMEVIPNSPASIAGLRPFSDYIVGSTEIIFQDSEDFFSLVNSNIDKQLHFFVYNKDTDDIRQVTITPTRNWPGDGCLGCNVAYGLLHKIPSKPATLDAPKPFDRQLEIPAVESLPPIVLAQSDHQFNQPPFPTTPIPSFPTPSPVQNSPYTPVQNPLVLPTTPVPASSVYPTPFTPSTPSPAPINNNLTPLPVPSFASLSPQIPLRSPLPTTPYTPTSQYLPQTPVQTYTPTITSPTNIAASPELEALKAKQLALHKQLEALRATKF